MQFVQMKVKFLGPELQEHFTVGKEYICTAYLPEMEKFAVVGDTTWITFDWSEEEFLKKFEIIGEIE